MKIIHSEQAPAAIGPYSQAYEANGFIFTSGQLGINPSTGKMPETITEQLKTRKFKNIPILQKAVRLHSAIGALPGCGQI